jgi:hypothetical protein
MFLLLGLFVFLVYLLSSSWEFPLTSDGSAMLATSRSLLTQRTLAIDPSFTSDIADHPSAKIGTDGRAYAKYGLGLPILELPFVSAALLISKFTGAAEARSLAVALSLLNPLLTALTSVVVCALCQSLGCKRIIALAAALAYSFSTFAWFAAVMDLSEALQALCLAAAMLLLIRYGSEQRMRYLWGSGFALASAILTKTLNVMMFPAFALYLMALCRRHSFSRQERFLALLRFAILPAACLMGLAWLNLVRFGSIWDSGYNSPMFTNPLPGGLYGLLLSPNKGLFFYAPVALLVPPGLWLMSRRYKAESAMIMLGCLLYPLLPAKFFGWGGGTSWGPRYLTPLLPMMMIPAARAVADSRILQLLGIALFTVGLSVNFLGVIISELAYESTITEIYLPEQTGTLRLGSLTKPGQIVERPIAVEDVLPEFSPLLGHIWLARVALDGCECDEDTARCRCASGALEENAIFRSPPWKKRYPAARPVPPAYGYRIIQPWIAHQLHQWFIYDPGAAAP